VDPANKTLFGPPNNGGGSNVVAGVTKIASAFLFPNAGLAGYTVPGWIVGQIWSAGTDVFVYLPSIANNNAGYGFNFQSASGSQPCQFISWSSFSANTQNTSPASLVYYQGTNPANTTGWINFAIYIGANGYMGVWINNKLVADVTDTLYVPNTAAQYYGNVTGSANLIAPTANAAGAGSSGLNSQGSIIPNQPVNDPSYTTATTSISFSWSSQTMGLSDGSTVTIPSGSKSYTGLTAGTTYYFYPYIRVSDFTIQFANGTPPPTAPSAAFALQANSDGCYAMNPLTVATTVTGGGSGGGGGHCPESAELVDVLDRGLIQAGQVAAGDFIKGYSFHDKADVYRKVTSVSSGPCGAWRILNGHKVSPCEPVWDGTNWTPAFKVPGAVFDGSAGIKIALHVDRDDFDECNFYLASGTPLLIHNQMIVS
jgi:hypothetical protein